jgi:hypothetical protein
MGRAHRLVPAAAGEQPVDRPGHCPDLCTTSRLPFLIMSVTALRLSAADRAKHKRKMKSPVADLWPSRHKIFAPVCAHMRWIPPSSAAPAVMTSPPRPSSFRAAAMVEDLDVLNTSCCTETLSPGLQVRAA